MQQLEDVLLPINFVKFVCFISLASVQIYFQVVPLCDCNNNIRKQVYMGFEQVKVFIIQQVSKDKFILQRDQLFNLTRTFFGIFLLYTQMLCLNCVAAKFLDVDSSL